MIAIESDSRIQPETEPLPETYAPEIVLTFARMAGYKGDTAPKVAIFDETNSFPEVTAFTRSSKGDGYYRTTYTSCTCPDSTYRAGPRGKLCKHQSRLIAFMDKMGFDQAMIEYTERMKTYQPDPLPMLEGATTDTTPADTVETAEELRIRYENEHIGTKT